MPPKAKCNYCKEKYVSWALNNPGSHFCLNCGAELKTEKEGDINFDQSEENYQKIKNDIYASLMSWENIEHNIQHFNIIKKLPGRIDDLGTDPNLANKANYLVDNYTQIIKSVHNIVTVLNDLKESV